MGSPRSSEIKQKIKTGAEYTGYTIGGIVVLSSVVIVGLSAISNLFKLESLSGLEENYYFKIAEVVSFAVMAIALIGVSIHDYTKKKAGINYTMNADEGKTLEDAKVNSAFETKRDVESALSQNFLNKKG